MSKILWLTAGCFLDHTFPLLNHLSKRMEIKWVVVVKKGSSAANHAREYADQNGIDLEFYYSKHNWYNPLSFKDAKDMMSYISQKEVDVYFFDYTTFPHLFIFMHKYMKGKKLLIAMHHGKAHSGMRFTYLYDKYLNWLKKQKYYYLFFSNSQNILFNSNYPDKKYVIQLPVNNTFGISEKKPSENLVVFQYFGHMISTKNVGLLIKAACKLKEMTNKPFLVRIYGHCRNWDNLYQPLVMHPDIFDIRHESIPDEEIPDVFSSAHYLLQPYKTVTQSGPTKLAYGYHLPVIVSDLPGFRESVVENVTGLFFKSEDVSSLTAMMKRCIDEHPQLYNKLKESQQNYVERNLSVDSIINQYEVMFNKIANN